MESFQRKQEEEYLELTVEIRKQWTVPPPLYFPLDPT